MHWIGATSDPLRFELLFFSSLFTSSGVGGGGIVVISVYSLYVCARARKWHRAMIMCVTYEWNDQRKGEKNEIQWKMSCWVNNRKSSRYNGTSSVQYIKYTTKYQIHWNICKYRCETTRWQYHHHVYVSVRVCVMAAHQEIWYNNHEFVFVLFVRVFCHIGLQFDCCELIRSYRHFDQIYRKWHLIEHFSLYLSCS